MVRLFFFFLGLAPWCLQAEVHEFSVEVRASPDEAVLVVGSAEELGAGDHLRAVMLAPQGDGKWGGKIRLAVGTTGTYRYLKRKTGAEEFEDPANVVFVGKSRVMPEVEGGRKNEAREVKGKGKLEIPKYLGSPIKEFPGRMIRVWLPPGYEGGKERYPVVYCHAEYL